MPLQSARVGVCICVRLYKKLLTLTMQARHSARLVKTVKRQVALTNAVRIVPVNASMLVLRSASDNGFLPRSCGYQRASHAQRALVMIRVGERIPGGWAVVMSPCQRSDVPPVEAVLRPRRMRG